MPSLETTGRKRNVTYYPPVWQLQRGKGSKQQKPPTFIPPPSLSPFLLLPASTSYDWSLCYGINLRFNFDLFHRSPQSYIESNGRPPLLPHLYLYTIQSTDIYDWLWLTSPSPPRPLPLRLTLPLTLILLSPSPINPYCTWNWSTDYISPHTSW